MRRILLAVLAVGFAVSFASPLMAQGSPQQGGADQPYTVSTTTSASGDISRSFCNSSSRIISRYLRRSSRPGACSR